jgi:hypothetical protein
MVDRYTKAVLTIIAAALLAIALENALPKASAQGGCGTLSFPCVVQFPGNVPVVVANSPLWVVVDNTISPRR